jgi:hypothetical protein
MPAHRNERIDVFTGFSFSSLPEPKATTIFTKCQEVSAK